MKIEGSALTALARVGQQAMFHGSIVDRKNSIYKIDVLGTTFQYFESRYLAKKRVRDKLTEVPMVDRSFRGANWDVLLICPTTTERGWEWGPTGKYLRTPNYDQYLWGEVLFTVVDQKFTGDEVSFEHDIIIAQMLGTQSDDWADQAKNLEG